MTDDNDRLPPIGRPYRKGERVTITCEGRTVDAEIVIASPNGRSLALMFEALLAGHAGFMPVLQQGDGTFVSLLGSVPVEIRKRH